MNKNHEQEYYDDWFKQYVELCNGSVDEAYHLICDDWSRSCETWEELKPHLDKFRISYDNLKIK